MEVLMKELFEAVKTSNASFDWAAIISAVCSVISLVAIFILLKERRERKRPYLQATFELIKDSLVCIVIRNVGEVPAKLLGITYNNDFVMQLDEQGQKNIRQASHGEISIYPKQQWVICLGESTISILKKKNLVLHLSLRYSAVDKPRKEYSDPSDIDFNGYRGFMIYISETDELKNEVKEMAKILKTMSDLLKQHYKIPEPTVITQAYYNTEDDHLRNIVTVLNSPESDER